jgi:hypothetical protein
MVDAPIPPVDPIVRSPRTLGVYRGNPDGFDHLPPVDARMVKAWNSTLRDEAERALRQAQARGDTSTFERLSEMLARQKNRWRDLWGRSGKRRPPNGDLEVDDEEPERVMHSTPPIKHSRE